jgi:broad specificity phosphatase PhoE
MQNIFIIRHGRSTANDGVPNSPFDCLIELTEDGKTKVAKSAELFKEYAAKNNILYGDAKVFASPFIRANQTAKIYCETLFNKNKPQIIPEISLREMDFGIFNRIPPKQRESVDKAEAQKLEASLTNHCAAFYHRIKEGETYAEVWERERDFYEKHKNEKTIFIFAHYRSGICMLLHFLDMQNLGSNDFAQKIMDFRNADCFHIQIDGQNKNFNLLHFGGDDYAH